MSGMSVRTLRAPVHLTLHWKGPATAWHAHKPLAPGPWPPSLLFQQPPTESATLTSLGPVGMVTLPSPRPVTLARPNTLPGVFLCESVQWAWVSGGTHLALIQTGWHSATTQTPTDIVHVFSASLTVGFLKKTNYHKRHISHLSGGSSRMLHWTQITYKII